MVTTKCLLGFHKWAYRQPSIYIIEDYKQCSCCGKRKMWVDTRDGEKY